MRTNVARAGSTLALAAGLLAGCQTSPRRSPYADNPLLQSRPPLQQTSSGKDRLNQIAQAGPRTVVPPPGMPNGTTYTPATTTAQTSAAPGQQPVYAATTTTYATPPMPDAGPVMPDPVAMALAAPTLPDPLPAQAAAPTPITTAAVAPTMPPPAPLPVPADSVNTVAATAPAPPVPPMTPPAPVAPMPETPAPQRQVNGRFGHASDYTWLHGELDKHYRGNLELRYQSHTEEDAYGGKVRLEDDPRLNEFRPGDIIAVEGEFVRDSANPSQAGGQNQRYRIRSIQLVERK